MVISFASLRTPLFRLINMQNGEAPPPPLPVGSNFFQPWSRNRFYVIWEDGDKLVLLQKYLFRDWE